MVERDLIEVEEDIKEEVENLEDLLLERAKLRGDEAELALVEKKVSEIWDLTGVEREKETLEDEAAAGEGKPEAFGTLAQCPNCMAALSQEDINKGVCPICDGEL